ncbi:hypothetical protein HELRODRAFT_181123 [Helobdella robusta]|uniref:Uncharacterized protein n=1 Tax=Helobdella robusta TaxID=6412 RepID=T1FGM9_HELRO|nr:hypothetical protein HELRODRAFT_181123 [Helobdella robusta]ESN93203.1 hypothetical protein HELRODRAFT_181123 [Helobdella robusta]
MSYMERSGTRTEAKFEMFVLHGEIFLPVSLGADFVIQAGDLNVHVERTDDDHAVNLREIFELFNMRSRVEEPSHVYGVTLDLVQVNFPLVFKLPVVRKNCFVHGIVWTIISSPL